MSTNIKTSIVLERPDLPASNEYLFYIVLHGAISLVESVNPDGTGELRAYLIDMGSEHQYLAGTWLSETPIPHGTVAKLTGVPDQALPRRASLEDGKDKHPIFDIPSFPNLDSAQYHSVFRLPLPANILYFNRSEVSFSGDRAPVARSVAETKVLQYSLATPEAFLAALQTITGDRGAAFGAVALDPVALTTAGLTSFVDLAGGYAGAIHILNAPPRTPPDGHPENEFAKSVQALGVGNPAISFPGDGVPALLSRAQLADDPLPPGISKLEVGIFESRKKLTDELALFLRTGSFNTGSAQCGDPNCPECCSAAHAVVKNIGE